MDERLGELASQYTSEADLSEWVWLDRTSRFAHALPFENCSIIIYYTYGGATALCDTVMHKVLYNML